MMLRLDLSLSNPEVYRDLEIVAVTPLTAVAMGMMGKSFPHLLRPDLPGAADIVGANLEGFLARLLPPVRKEVCLCGAGPVWAYLLSLAAVLPSTEKVWFHDGKNPPILIASRELSPLDLLERIA